MYKEFEQYILYMEWKKGRKLSEYGKAKLSQNMIQGFKNFVGFFVLRVTWVRIEYVKIFVITLYSQFVVIFFRNSSYQVEVQKM